MSGAYNVGKRALLDGTIDWVATTLKLMLLKSTYVFDPDQANVGVGLTAGEVVGSGYTGGYGGSGRIAVTAKSLFQDDPNDRVQMRGNPVNWPALNVGSVAACALILETGGSDATAIPLVFIDGPAFPIASAGGSFTLTPAATGLLQLR